jgi:hypothetical protein
MKGLKKMLWLAAALALIMSLIVPSALAIAAHSKQETVERMPFGGSMVVGESATGTLDENQPQSEYEKGYQAGYQAGLRDAFQWMITTIQGQMAGIPLEGPKIKQAVDSLTLHVGSLS